MFHFQSGNQDLLFDDDIFDEYLSCPESDDEAEDINDLDGYETDDESDAGSHSEIEDEFDLNFREDENDNYNFTFGYTLAKALVLWAVKFGISHNAITELLNILKNFGHDELPKTARTLLHTPRKAVQPRACGTGLFHYRGIRFNVLHYDRDFLRETDTIEFDFFIDGLSLSESSKVKMWPIMGSFAHQPCIRPFVVACYSGTSDPVEIDDYMREFVQEIKLLQQKGIEVTKDRIVKNFKFRCFIADAPARALASCTMGHASYFGCPKCNQVCCSEGHKLYYQFFIGELRTDESFRKREDIQHHRPEFQHKTSLLEEVIGMVSQIVIEAMHAVDLGVTKRICKAIINNEVFCCKITKAALAALQARFKSFRPYIPTEFARKPRCLNELSGFKATEFRQMLLYTLPVLLKNIVSPQLHKQILKLHVAIRLLSDPIRYKENIEAARKLITDFVNEYDDTIGKKNFTYYTHCLLHITDYVELYGPLYSLSAYKYENHMRLIKRLLRRKNGHIKQFFNRVDEMRFADEIADDLNINDHNKDPKINEFNLEAGSLRDGCCMVEPGYPVLISATFVQNGITMVRGNRFLTCRDFYDDPVPSMENMGTILASNLSQTMYEFPATAITHKFFRVPLENEFNTMERLVINKWVKPKCGGNSATKFANKTPSVISFKASAKPKTPYFRQPKQKSISLPEPYAPLKTINKDNFQNRPIEPHFKRPLPPPSVKFRTSHVLSSRVPAQPPRQFINSNAMRSVVLPTLIENSSISETQSSLKSISFNKQSYPNETRNTSNNVEYSGAQKTGIKVITTVTQSESRNEPKQNAPLTFNLPFKLCLCKRKPWTSFTEASGSSLCVNDETKRTAMHVTSDNEPLIHSQETASNLVGKKVVLSKEILKMLVPLPSHFKLKTNVASNDSEKIQIFKIPTTMQHKHVSADGATNSRIHQLTVSLANENSDCGVKVPFLNSDYAVEDGRTNSSISHPNVTMPLDDVNFGDGSDSPIHHSYHTDGGGNIQPKMKSSGTAGMKIKLTDDVGENDDTKKIVSLDEFNKLKRKEARNSAVLKVIVRKLKEEEAEVASFSYPINEMAEFGRFTHSLKNSHFTNKLVTTLQKKILKSKDVVSDLVETIFTPKLIFDFNVNGYNKQSFKKTKINDIFFELSKMDHEKYYINLAKVIHKMHARHRRT